MSKIHRKLVELCYDEFGSEELELFDSEKSKEFEDMIRSGRSLPEGVCRDPETGEFYEDLTSEELKELLLFKKAVYLKSIEKYMILSARLSQIAIIVLLLILIVVAF